MNIYVLTISDNFGSYTPRVFKTNKEAKDYVAKKKAEIGSDEHIKAIKTLSNGFEAQFIDDTFLEYKIYMLELKD